MHNHHVNVLPIVNWQIQNYLIHHTHLNTMYLVKLSYSSHTFEHNVPCINYHCDTKNEPLNHAFTLLKGLINDFFPTPLYLEDTRITWILTIEFHKRFLDPPCHWIVLMEIFCITWRQMFLKTIEKKLLQMLQKGTPMFVISQVWKMHSTLKNPINFPQKNLPNTNTKLWVFLQLSTLRNELWPQ